ncbi:facilitated trehalose transporter Tret1-like [Diabrotica undecimpunctata]|uniref:facilitated trehalose transporter Tret1-like n=1 Tax=Diabrotica undecimpunctata TaxID=50387 RepID=UPI003B634F8E
MNTQELNERKTKKFNFHLYFSSLTGDLLYLTIGCFHIWSSSGLPQLMSPDTTINPLSAPITTLQVSVITSLNHLCMPIGIIVMTRLAYVLGRKKSMLLVAVTYTISLTATAFANHMTIYYICISVCGICDGASLCIVPIYNSEISENHNRGLVGCIMGFSMQTGLFLAYFYGYFFQLKTYFLLCALPCILHVCIQIFIQDSPVSLAIQEKKLKALNVLEKLRPTKTTTDLEIEYTIIDAAIKEHNTKSLKDIFLTTAPRRGFFIALVVCTTQHCSGIFIILSFMASIFNQAGSGLSGNTVGAIVGVFQMATDCVAVYLIEKCGRRILILTSSFSCVFPMFLLGFYFYLKHINANIITIIGWFPVACVIVFIICYGIGLGSAPIAIIGELFPSDLRAKGVGLTLVLNSLAISFMIFCYPLATKTFGIHICMWLFSFLCLLGCITLYFILPETKGKSFCEIQNMLDIDNLK